ncbi:hypothetical protein TPY_2722 [Sulfobacillus acidophilus TPY]|uniref:Uncharacterized protein n=1 Tax=Sulfobacillus acidophilus (strain ATCC 700253 / DSM 10332 / NAL) TaxID=679936 RepID=G8TUL1_SULAD|nr:hypothetical protein TPY_2722 [Sulfobacillus acidophilus TPY]AEW04658.1 hypothetical protein Sulac_1158 [Sulfobacillus acidophilus DSM 10332]
MDQLNRTVMAVADWEWDALLAGEYVAISADVFQDSNASDITWVFRFPHPAEMMPVQIVRRNQHTVYLHRVGAVQKWPGSHTE